MKASRRSEERANRRRKIAVVLAVLFTVGLVLWLGRPAATKSPGAPVATASATDAPHDHEVSSPRGVSSGGIDARPPGEQQDMTDEERQAWLTHMQETRATFLEKTKYPPTSLPLAGKFDLIDPHHVEQSSRPLMQDPETKGPGKVKLDFWQSQLWLGEGETASAFVAVSNQDGSKPSVHFTRSALHRGDDKTDGMGALLEPIVFHDDGVAPDNLAGDNIFAATIPSRPQVLRGVLARLILDIDLTADDEHGTFRFHFATTGPAPARFTGVITDGIELGSLAFHVGIDVKQTGRYNIMARVYDAEGKPAALLTFVDELTVASREIVLTAFGKTLRDQNLKSPFSLRDLEGFCYVENRPTDRAVMAVWPGPHVTSRFDMNSLSDDEWDSPERAKESDVIDNVIAHGPSEIAPVDSNGIPLPPMPLVLPRRSP